MQLALGKRGRPLRRYLLNNRPDKIQIQPLNSPKLSKNHFRFNSQIKLAFCINPFPTFVLSFLLIYEKGKQKLICHSHTYLHLYFIVGLPSYLLSFSCWFLCCFMLYDISRQMIIVKTRKKKEFFGFISFVLGLFLFYCQKIVEQLCQGDLDSDLKLCELLKTKS